MSDEELRTLERTFDQSPTLESSLALAVLAHRLGNGEILVKACSWLLALESWDSLSHTECDRVGRLIAEFVSPRLTFMEAKPCEQGEVSRFVCFFEDDQDRVFALIPAGQLEIGFDPAEFDPTSLNEELRSWELQEEQEAQDYEDPEQALQEAMERIEEWRETVRVGLQRLRPRRVVNLAPIFCQCQPDNVFGQGGPASHAALSQRVAADGYRLLSSDEWEHCCSAGTKTLFRWGNDWPTEEMDPLAEPPNAFGLTFFPSPSGVECCAEPDRVRNGDGGDGLHGGDAFGPFLSLSSFFEKRVIPNGWSSTVYRRALSLAEALRATSALGNP